MLTPPGAVGREDAEDQSGRGGRRDQAPGGAGHRTDANRHGPGISGDLSSGVFGWGLYGYGGYGLLTQSRQTAWVCFFGVYVAMDESKLLPKLPGLVKG